MGESERVPEEVVEGLLHDSIGPHKFVGTHEVAGGGDERQQDTAEHQARQD